MMGSSGRVRAPATNADVSETEEIGLPRLRVQVDELVLGEVAAAHPPYGWG
jgi:hypothetical protein